MDFSIVKLARVAGVVEDLRTYLVAPPGKIDNDITGSCEARGGGRAQQRINFEYQPKCCISTTDPRAGERVSDAGMAWFSKWLAACIRNAALSLTHVILMPASCSTCASVRRRCYKAILLVAKMLTLLE